MHLCLSLSIFIKIVEEHTMNQGMEPQHIQPHMKGKMTNFALDQDKVENESSNNQNHVNSSNENILDRVYGK